MSWSWDSEGECSIVFTPKICWKGFSDTACEDTPFGSQCPQGLDDFGWWWWCDDHVSASHSRQMIDKNNVVRTTFKRRLADLQEFSHRFSKKNNKWIDFLHQPWAFAPSRLHVKHLRLWNFQGTWPTAVMSTMSTWQEVRSSAQKWWWQYLGRTMALKISSNSMWSLFFLVGVGKMEVECAPWGLWLNFLPGDYSIIYIFFLHSFL